MRDTRIRRDGGMGRYGDLRRGGRQVIGAHQGYLFGILIHNTADSRILDVEGQELALGRVNPVTGYDNVTGCTRGIGVREMVLLREIQDTQARLNLAVGLQFGAHAGLDHVNLGLVVGGLGIVEGHRNHKAALGRVFDIQFGHFLVHEGTEGEVSRKGGDSLPFDGGFHVFGLMAGGCDQHQRQYGKKSFHKAISTLHIVLLWHYCSVPKKVWGSGPSGKDSCGPCHPRKRSCIHTGRRWRQG